MRTGAPFSCLGCRVSSVVPRYLILSDTSQHDGARKVAELEGQVNELTRAVRHQAEVIEALQ